MSSIKTKQKPDKQSLGYGPLSAVFITLGAYAGSQIFAGVWLGLMAQLLPLALGWEAQRAELWLDTSVLAQFLTILVLEVAFLYIIWIFLKLVRVKISEIGLVKPVLKDVVRAVAGYGVYFVALVIVTALAQEFIPGLDLDQEQDIGFSTATSGIGLVLVFISLVILPPIAEEIAARGLLYTGLRSRLPAVAAAIITSVLFAVAHLQWGNGTPLLWVAALDTFILSLILVYLREKTGSLWPSIMVHMIKNGFAFLVLFIFKAA